MREGFLECIMKVGQDMMTKRLEVLAVNRVEATQRAVIEF